VSNGAQSQSSAQRAELFELFKFYEEAASRAKTDAWTQTSWVLTLVGGILAFSINLYVEHQDIHGYVLITWACAAAALLLTGYLAYVLHELGTHIRNYWTQSNQLASIHPFLRQYVMTDDSKVLEPGKKAAFPPFIWRLGIPPALFAFGHLAWAIYVSVWLGTG
jgi:hypothetical protein